MGSSEGKKDTLIEPVVNEHQLHYNIYYNELQIYYTKMTICITIQLALFSGVVLKFNELITNKLVMMSCIVLLLPFSIIELLISIRGYFSNNAVIATIQKFEDENDFTFLKTFNDEVHKHRKLTKMNFPSLAMCFTSSLFVVLWTFITLVYIVKTYPVSIQNLRCLCLDNSIFHISLSAIVGALLAVTMKIADMIDEHGLFMFKHADAVFGILWGICGGFLVLIDSVTASAMMAMMIGYVIRGRLDKANHIIAFCIVIFTYFYKADVDRFTLLMFTVPFTVLGKIKDLKYLKKSNKLSKAVETIYIYVPLIYAVPTLVYSAVTGSWAVFAAMFMFDFTYNIVRILAKRKEWYVE